MRSGDPPSPRLQRARSSLRFALRTKRRLERVTRLELATSSLASRCSTTELHPRKVGSNNRSRLRQRNIFSLTQDILKDLPWRDARCRVPNFWDMTAHVPPDSSWPNILVATPLH